MLIVVIAFCVLLVIGITDTCSIVDTFEAAVATPMHIADTFDAGGQ